MSDCRDDFNDNTMFFMVSSIGWFVVGKAEIGSVWMLLLSVKAQATLNSSEAEAATALPWIMQGFLWKDGG